MGNLFYPLCEARSLGELLAFNKPEDHNVMMILVIDLYAAQITNTPNTISLTDTMIDSRGFYALARTDQDNHYFPKGRQLGFYGGLRWKFEQYIPKTQAASVDR